MRRRMHHPIPEQGRWLDSVQQGHYNYYAVPDNSEALHGFRRLIRLWLQALRARRPRSPSRHATHAPRRALSRAPSRPQSRARTPATSTDNSPHDSCRRSHPKRSRPHATAARCPHACTSSKCGSPRSSHSPGGCRWVHVFPSASWEGRVDAGCQRGPVPGGVVGVQWAVSSTIPALWRKAWLAEA